LREYVDSAQAVFGPMELAGHLAPSFYDKLIHTINPRHNPSYEVWIYRPGRRSSFLPSGDIGVDTAEITGRPALPLN